MDRMRLLLKKKYALVHVPSRHKAEAWLSLTRALQAAGSTPEQAGLRAAHQVFPYECKEYALYSGPTLEEIVASAEDDSGRADGNPR